MADHSLVIRSLHALTDLGISDGDLRARLLAGYQHWIPILSRDLPKDDQSRLEVLKGKLMRVQDPNRGSVVASLEQMSDEEVKKVAIEFADLCANAILDNDD
jgi:uncharacterized protein YjiS (DUF1127 family)